MCFPSTGQQSEAQSTHFQTVGLRGAELGLDQPLCPQVPPAPPQLCLAAEPLDAGLLHLLVTVPGAPTWSSPGEAVTFIYLPGGVPRWFNFIFAKHSLSNRVLWDLGWEQETREPKHLWEEREKEARRQ